MLSTLLLAALIGCGGEPTTPQPQPKPAVPQGAEAPKRAPVKAKAKTGNMVPGRGKAKAPRGKAPGMGRGKRPAPGGALPKPIGAAGPVKGTLVLEVKEVDLPAPPPPAPVGEGAEPVPAPAPAKKTSTDASIALAWGEGQTADAKLGSVDGVCTSVPPAPVGPEGRERTPMWTVSCEHEGQTSQLYILQVGNVLAVVRGVPTGNEAKPTAYKPVRRIRLVPGATIERAG